MGRRSQLLPKNCTVTLPGRSYKKFDNLDPTHHLHWSKWEVYDINSSHYAMGLIA